MDNMLHIACLNDEFQEFMDTWLQGADVNAKADIQPHHGVTPSHMASLGCSIRCLQAIIGFGGDTEVLDDEGRSPLHYIPGLDDQIGTEQHEKAANISSLLHSQGAPRCPVGQNENCHPACHPASTYTGSPVSIMGMKFRLDEIHTPVKTSDTVACSSEIENALYFDGGGMRGLSLLAKLLLLRKEVSALAKGPVEIQKYFQVLGGSSTGGIIALGLAMQKTPEEMCRLYIRVCREIFVGRMPHSSQEFQLFLEKEFGESKMSEIPNHKVCVTLTLGDEEQAIPLLCRSYSPPKGVDKSLPHPDPNKTRVSFAAQATSAAPSMFDLNGEKFLDGGITENNPTTRMLEEHALINDQTVTDKKKLGIIVSLGCGVNPIKFHSLSSWDVHIPKGPVDAVVVGWRVIYFMKLLANIATRTDGCVVRDARRECKYIGAEYYRLSEPHLHGVELDEKDEEKLTAMMCNVFVHFKKPENYVYIKDLAIKLHPN